jgi:hypothetical protein
MAAPANELSDAVSRPKKLSALFVAGAAPSEGDRQRMRKCDFQVGFWAQIALSRLAHQFFRRQRFKTRIGNQSATKRSYWYSFERPEMCVDAPDGRWKTD